MGGVGLDGEISRSGQRSSTLAARPRWFNVFSLPPASVEFAAFPMKNPSKLGLEKTDDFMIRSDESVVVATFANTPVYGGGMKDRRPKRCSTMACSISAW